MNLHVRSRPAKDHLPFVRVLLIASLLSLLLAPPVFAQASDDEYPFEGFYFGGQLGLTQLPVSSSGSFGPNPGSMDGVGGGAFVGAELRLGPTYDAFEFEIGYDGSRDKYDVWPKHKRAKGKTTLGVHYRLGYVHDDRYLFYSRLGWQITKFKNLTPHLSETKHLQGVRFGGGMEAMIQGPMSLRLEYTYTWYRDPIHKPGQDLDIGQHMLRLGVGFHLF